MGDTKKTARGYDRSVCFDRFALAAGHDLAGAGRLRRDDDAAIVLQRNKDQWENKLCSAQKGTSFL